MGRFSLTQETLIETRLSRLLVGGQAVQIRGTEEILRDSIVPCGVSVPTGRSEGRATTVRRSPTAQGL